MPFRDLRGRQAILVLLVAGSTAFGVAGSANHSIASELSVVDPELADAISPTLFRDSEEAYSLGGGRSVTAELRSAIAAQPVVSDPWPPDEPSGVPLARRRWDVSHTLVLPGFPGWSLPKQPTWTEDPYANPTWVLEYQSLSWLIPASTGEPTPHPPDWHAVNNYVMSWIVSHSAATNDPNGAWNDHAVALRTDALVTLWSTGLREHLADWQLRAFIKSLALHGRLLRGFLDDPQWTGHNHGLFHAIALYNLARSFPWIEGASEWRKRSRERIDELLGEMVDRADAMSLEQSVGYQFLVVDLFWRTERWLASTDDPFTGAEDTLIQRMGEVAALFIDPLGELPAVGDTWYGELPDMAAISSPELASPELQFLLSHATTGRAPPDATFLPSAGYAIFRPEYRTGPGWSADSQVVFDAGPSVKFHGHQDALNVIFTSHGSHLIVDRGGPYIYVHPGRQAFLDASAHNGVIIDGRNYTDSTGTGAATWSQSQDAPSYSVVTAFQKKNPAVTSVRTVLLIKPDLLIILDRLIPGDRDNHTYAANFALAPDLTVEDVGSRGLELKKSETGIAAMAFDSSDPSLTVTESGVGWGVTIGPSKRLPDTTVTASLQGGSAWLLTIVAPGADRLGWLRVSHSAESDGSTDVTVLGAGHDVSFAFGLDSGPVTVEAAR